MSIVLIYVSVIDLSKYKLIMSDLDNTLLPIYTQDKFVEIWFSDISEKFRSYGLDPVRAAGGVNQGVRAMLYNESGRKNIDVFYDEVEKISGYKREQIEPPTLDYYSTTFSNVYDITLPNPYAVRIAELMRQKAEHTAVATMPVFTIEAVAMRMAWVGLNPEMFDHVTTADTSCYCKPNPLYFQEILDRFGVKADEALMIGNDVREDMQPCKKLGIDVFLVTNHMITHDMPYDEFRRGTYEELIDYLGSLS